jgi:hypothetical protein
MSKVPLRPRFCSSDTSSSALLAVLILLTFVLYPLGEIAVVGAVLPEAFFSLLLITGITSASRSRMVTAILSSIAAATMLSGWWGRYIPALLQPH